MKPKWIEIAEKEIGQKEIPGQKSNPRIVEYHKATRLGATDDSVPWCSSFVNWVMMKARCQRTYSAAARSWLQDGICVKLKGFRPGCIVVLKRGRNPWTGHVGFAMRLVGDRVEVLGGNQSDQVKLSTAYKQADVLGYFWPIQLAQDLNSKV